MQLPPPASPELLQELLELLRHCQREIANRYLEAMGFGSNQYVVYRHYNTQHDHICASRIRLDNDKIVHDSWDYKRSETIIR